MAQACCAVDLARPVDALGAEGCGARGDPVRGAIGPSAEGCIAPCDLVRRVDALGAEGFVAP